MADVAVKAHITFRRQAFHLAAGTLCRNFSKRILLMTEHIQLRDRPSRALWCRRFRCTDSELLEAVRAIHSIDPIEIGLYLSTRRALEAFRVTKAA